MPKKFIAVLYLFPPTDFVIPENVETDNAHLMFCQLSEVDRLAIQDNLGLNFLYTKLEESDRPINKYIAECVKSSVLIIAKTKLTPTFKRFYRKNKLPVVKHLRKKVQLIVIVNGVHPMLISMLDDELDEYMFNHYVKLGYMIEDRIILENTFEKLPIK